MPSPKQSDNPDHLTEAVTSMVTKAELARIKNVMRALGMSKSAAVRYLLRSGLDTPQVKSLTPQEEDQTP